MCVGEVVRAILTATVESPKPVEEASSMCRAMMPLSMLVCQLITNASGKVRPTCMARSGEWVAPFICIHVTHLALLFVRNITLTLCKCIYNCALALFVLFSFVKNAFLISPQFILFYLCIFFSSLQLFFFFGVLLITFMYQN